MPDVPAIDLFGISFSYGDAVILKDVNLSIAEKDFLGIIGPNGSGKTTLLKIILGLLKPSSGTAKIFGDEPVRARKLIGYVPQHADLDRNFPVNVMDVTLMGRLSRTSLFGRYSKADREAAEAALEDMVVADLMKKSFGNLSGGQRQRVLIARALASQPRLLLFDEPTANVDTKAENDIYELLSKLNESTTIAMVSHDIGFVSSYVKHVACLNRTLVCHPTAGITQDVIEDLYKGPMDLVQHHHVHHHHASAQRRSDD
jgi:zinc transport system ATP-binding protein